ncbi:MAG: hypothetical protein MR821_09705 [Clostridiales bacterium]|nr:hypothetical protein [Clostridiales bacterium]
MEERTRLEAFEAMLAGVRVEHEDVQHRMAQLKAQGKERSAAYRQLMGRRMQLAELLALYRTYGLVEG